MRQLIPNLVLIAALTVFTAPFAADAGVDLETDGEAEAELGGEQHVDDDEHDHVYDGDVDDPAVDDDGDAVHLDLEAAGEAATGSKHPHHDD